MSQQEYEDNRLDIVAVERITLDENEVNVVMLSDGSRALKEDDIVSLLKREKRHSRALLRKRYPEYNVSKYCWSMVVNDTKCFFHFSPYIGLSVIPLIIVIDLVRYYASSRTTKSANLLRELEEYAARPFEPHITAPVDEPDTTPHALDKFTDGVIRNLSEALATCKDDRKRSEVVSIIQSLITLL